MWNIAESHSSYVRIFSLFSLFGYVVLTLLLPDIATAQTATPIPIDITTEIVAKSDIIQVVYTFMGIIVFAIGTFIGKEMFRR